MPIQSRPSIQYKQSNTRRKHTHTHTHAEREKKNIHLPTVYRSLDRTTTAPWPACDGFQPSHFSCFIYLFIFCFLLYNFMKCFSFLVFHFMSRVLLNTAISLRTNKSFFFFFFFFGFPLFIFGSQWGGRPAERRASLLFNWFSQQLLMTTGNNGRFSSGRFSSQLYDNIKWVGGGYNKKLHLTLGSFMTDISCSCLLYRTRL